MDFTIRLAEQTVRISALYPTTMRFCQAYLTEEPTSLHLRIDPSDIDYEREKSEREDLANGIPPRRFSDEYLETLAVYRKIAEKMPDYDTILFHGSAIAVDGKGFLFTAKSGTGKSTHARLWRERFGTRAVMINDDKPLIRVGGTDVTVYGTPWDGKHHLSTNGAYPLKAICFLERSETNRVFPISKKDALLRLLRQAYRPADADMMRKTLILLDRLGDNVGLYCLQCNMDPDAAEVAYNGITERI